MVDKFCFMVCENLKGEAQAVIECERLDDVALVIFPADCYRPNSKNETIANILKDCKDKYDQVCLLGGGCIADAWEGFRALDSHRSLKVEQCANLFQSKRFIESYLKKGCYLLTPGWLDRWRHYITAWGFDRKTAQAFFKESASRLLLLDNGLSSRER